MLRALSQEDAPQIQRLFPHWETVRYLTAKIPWPYPPDGALSFIRDFALPAMERGDEWHWTLRLKSQPTDVIGAIALIKSEVVNRGFWLAQEHRHQGLMSEACDAVTDFWFRTLRFPVLRTIKAVANTDSRGISVRQGMRLISTTEHDFVSGRLPAEVWELTAEDWRQRKSRV